MVDDGEGEAPVPSEPSEEAWERPVDKFRRTAVGSVAAAWLFGLRDALESPPEKEQPAMIVDAPSEPARGNIDLVLDPEHPERSVVFIRGPVEEEN